MYKKLLFSIFILFCFCSHAEIFEITQIEKIRPYIQKESLVLFDIDDTLITNPNSLGGPTWRSWVKPKLPANSSFVLFDALSLYIAKNIDYIAIEPNTAQLISDLQRDDVAVFAFTARGRTQWYTTDLEGVDQFTHQQLNRACIDFNLSKIPAELQELESTYFYKGIIFAQHIKKGDLLKHLFKDLNYHPSCIVFIDDKLEQVKSVEAAVKGSGIPFVGFWYKKTEEETKNFDPMIVNIQLENLLIKNKILSNEDAKELLLRKHKIDPVLYLQQIFDQYDVNQLAPSFEG